MDTKQGIERRKSTTLGRLFALAVVLASCPNICSGAPDSNPAALVEQAKALLPKRNNGLEIVQLLEKAIDGFRRRGDKSISYAEALEMLTVLSRDSHLRLALDPRDAADLALQICELHGDSDSPTLALALELKAATADRRTGEWLRARAFQVRGERVSLVAPEIPLNLKLPITTDKTKGVKLPKIIKKVEPEYPELAEHVGLECSSTVLETIIDVSGVPGQFHLLRGCGYGFDENAVAALRQWRFRPALDRTGQPVTFRATVEVNFRIGPFR